MSADAETAPIDDRFRPVVAIAVEGFLAVENEASPGSAPTEDPCEEGASDVGDPEKQDDLDGDEPGHGGRWRWLSPESRSWVLSLSDRSMEVVWWSQRHDSVDGDLGHAPGLPHMPSARHLDQPRDLLAAEVGDSPLQTRAKGRPLLIVANVRFPRVEEDCIRMRRPGDRAITALRTIMRSDEPTSDTMAEMDAWLALTRTAPGREALRRHRRRMLARDRRDASRTLQVWERLPPVAEVDALAARFQIVDTFVEQLIGGIRSVLQERGYDLADLGTVNEIVKLIIGTIEHVDHAKSSATPDESDG